MENNKESNVSANAQVVEEKKYTETEFNAACNQLYSKLMKEIQARDMTNMFKRLDYLFKVVENESCFSESFVDSCVQEIETALTPVDYEENSKSKSEE